MSDGATINLEVAIGEHEFFHTGFEISRTSPGGWAPPKSKGGTLPWSCIELMGLETRFKRRGISMATAIILGALALTLAFALAGMSFSHLSVSNRLSNIAQARSLAEAAMSQAIERVVSSQGEFFEKAPFDWTVTMVHLPGGTGRLTFDPVRASDWKIPLSTYNLKSEISTTGFGGRMVPEKSLHFVAVGEYGGVTQRMESILSIPTYKYALSSQGQISSVGAMVVATADKPEDILPYAVEKLEKLLPGHILSNSANANFALDLSASNGKITITGDARAVGGITSEGGSLIIDGTSRPNSAPADMPVIEINDFDPSNFGPTQDFATPPAAVEVADGIFRHSGDLVLQKLKLPSNNTGSIVWVNGNLEINNGVSGVGAIFATGDITIHGAGQPTVTADNTMAVVAGKKLTIQGSGSNSAFFRGVVASGDTTDFEAVTVLGAVVVGATQVNGISVGSPNPTLRLTDTSVINVPEVVGFDFRYFFRVDAGGLGPGMDFELPNLSPGLDIRHKTGSNGGGEDARIDHFYNPVTKKFEPQPSQWDGFTDYHFDPSTKTSSGSPFGLHNGTKFLDQAEVIALLEASPGPYRLYASNHVSYQDFPDWASFYAAAPFANDHEGLVQHLVEYSRSRYTALMEKANDAYAKELKDQSPETGTFSMDPNQFINWDSRTRILLWRNL